MSDNKSNFVDKNPENQKPHNISGTNPRSVQTLHKSQVIPKSQDKDIEIKIVDEKDTVYKTKTTYLIQKAKMQLKRRVAPGVSEIIIRKNEEKRKLAEEKAKKEAETKAKEEAAKDAELKAKVEKEIEKQNEKIAQRKGVEEEVTEEEVTEETPAEETTVDVEEKIETAEEKVEETVSEEKETTQNEKSSSTASFTEYLREQGLIQGQKIIEAVEKAKPEIEAKIEETKVKVEEAVEEAKKQAEAKKSETTKTQESGETKSFTQYLREQGLIATDDETETSEVENEVKVEVKEEVKEFEENVEETKVESPSAETNNDGKSFTQYLREQGLIATDDSVNAPKEESTPKEEVKESVVEKEEVKETKEDKSSNEEVKTFIDLIRSEGLL